jgi:hypothetical protein
VSLTEVGFVKSNFKSGVQPMHDVHTIKWMQLQRQGPCFVKDNPDCYPSAQGPC